MLLQECHAKLEQMIKNDFPADQKRFLEKLFTIPNAPTLTLPREYTGEGTIGECKVEGMPFVITVGGTNGKGTTVALLEDILLRSGYRVGAYTSPHIEKITERFRVNGQMMSDNVFCELFEVAESAYADEEANWFEFLTFMGILFFSQHSLDILILEIGLGGEKDVVNTIEPDISIVTTIDFDHMERLGNTRDAIGRQKAGIFRANKPAICGDANPPESILNYAHEIGAQLFIQGKDFSPQLLKKYTEDTPHIPIQNVSTVLKALMCLPEKFVTPESAIRDSIKNLYVPGRWQVISQEPMIILDVAHNPQATAYLAGQLKQHSCSGKTYAIFGMAGRKAVEASLKPLINSIYYWFLVDINSEQPCVERAAAVLKHSYERVDSVSAALIKVKAIAKKHDRIIVFGSFMTVAEGLAD
jgi:dihydrofolate synthase/folylpolyglutamate synthase